MLGAKLRYLKASIAAVHHLLFHAFHLVAHDDGKTFRLRLKSVEAKCLKLCGAFALLYGEYIVTTLLERLNSFKSVSELA